MDDRSAMELAATQHALITRSQALSAGLTERQIDHRVSQRVLICQQEGVYRYAGAPRTRAQALLASLLAVGPVSAGSHRSAGAAYGIWTVRDEHVEITVTRDRTPELRGVTVHRIADLADRWITEVDGVPVTTLARTLVDLGAVLPLASVGLALDRALGRKLVSIAEVRAALNAVARKGRAGVGVIRALLKERQGAATVSVLQARMATLIRLHGLPSPVSEYTVLDPHGGFVGRVDFAYPELKYVIEVDGYEAHSSLRAFQHDRARQNDLVELGWTVHRFTWTDVNSHPGRVATRIRRVLGTQDHTRCG
jgi:hypothetical protein